MQYYIIVTSKDHMGTGAKTGFAQAGHSKESMPEKLDDLNNLDKDDCVIYHSSKEI